MGKIATLMMLALVLLVLTLVSGCKPAAEPVTPPTPAPAPVAPETMALSVEAAESLVATLYEVLGSSGALTFSPADDVTITRPEAKITFRPGAKVRYELTETGGTLTFDDPRPIIEARVFGLRVRPELTRIDLEADDSGTAHADLGVATVRKRFALDWQSDKPEGAAAAAVDALEPENVQSDPFAPDTEASGLRQDEREAVPVARASSRRVLVFWATWCGPCLAFDSGPLASLKRAGWQEGQHWERINIDERPDVASQYGVRQVPTLLLLEDGVEIDRHIGPLDPFAFAAFYSGR